MDARGHHHDARRVYATPAEVPRDAPTRRSRDVRRLHDRAVAQSEFSQLLRGKLEAFARTLEGREQTIFRERWLTEEPLTLQEIGDRYHVSRERARQLEKRLLEKLKVYLRAELGDAVEIAMGPE